MVKERKKPEDLFRIFRIGREATAAHFKKHRRCLGLKLHEDKLRNMTDAELQCRIADNDYFRFLANIQPEEDFCDLQDLGVVHEDMKRPIEIIRGAYGSIINASCEIIEDDSKLEKYRNKNIHQGQNMEPKELFFLKDECSICKILCDSDRYRLFKIEGKALEPHIKLHLQAFKAAKSEFYIFDSVYRETFADKLLRDKYDNAHPDHGKGMTMQELLVSCKECAVDRYRILKISRDATLDHITYHRNQLLKHYNKQDKSNKQNYDSIDIVYRETFKDKGLREDYDSEYPSHGSCLDKEEYLSPCEECANSSITQSIGRSAQRTRYANSPSQEFNSKRGHIHGFQIPLRALLSMLEGRLNKSESLSVEERFATYKAILEQLPYVIKPLLDDISVRSQDEPALETSSPSKYPCKDEGEHSQHREMLNKLCYLFHLFKAVPDHDN